MYPSTAWLRGSVLGAWAFAITVASPAFAAPPAPPQEDAPTWSRKLFKHAEALANDGRWADACPFFQAAHDLNATGGTAMRAGDCYEKIESYERAREMYRWVVDHAATDAVKDRVKVATARVQALEKQLRIEVKHTAPAPPPAPVEPSRVPAIVAFSIGGAGAVIGGAFGGLALAEATGVKTDASQRCPDKSCNDADLASRKASANTKAWVANVGLGVAIAGAAVGTVLLFVGGPEKKSDAAAVRVIRALGRQGISVSF